MYWYAHHHNPNRQTPRLRKVSTHMISAPFTEYTLLTQHISVILTWAWHGDDDFMPQFIHLLFTSLRSMLIFTWVCIWRPWFVLYRKIDKFENDTVVNLLSRGSIICTAVCAVVAGLLSVFRHSLFSQKYHTYSHLFFLLILRWSTLKSKYLSSRSIIWLVVWLLVNVLLPFLVFSRLLASNPISLPLHALFSLQKPSKMYTYLLYIPFFEKSFHC